MKIKQSSWKRVLLPRPSRPQKHSQHMHDDAVSMMMICIWDCVVAAEPLQIFLLVPSNNSVL